MVDSTNRRRFLAASGITVVGLSGCLGSDDETADEEQTQSDSSDDGSSDDNPDDNNPNQRTIQWGGQGSENATQDCAEDEVGFWKWVLTPGGPEAIEEATLFVTIQPTDPDAEPVTLEVEGFTPGGPRGVFQFNVFLQGGGTVQSAFVEFSGGGANPRLTISEGECREDDDPVDVTVITDPETDVNDSTATLNAELLPFEEEFDEVDVFFDYRVAGSTEWIRVPGDPESLSDDGGEFSAEIPVEPNTDYEFRAVAVAPDETEFTGEIRTFTKEDEPDVTKPTVVTGPATDVNESTATLNGELTDPGSFDVADIEVFFEYRVIGDEDWIPTDAQTLEELGPFSAEIDVEQGVEYEYRAVAEANDTRATGETLTFRKEVPDEELPEVATEPATDVNESTATLNGQLITLGDFDDVDVFFQYRIVGAEEWLMTSAQTLTEPGPFSDEISDLLTGVEYEFRAIATANDVVVAGPIQRFTKEPKKKERRKKKKLEKKKHAYERKKREYEKYKKKYEKDQIDKDTLEKKKRAYKDAKRKYEKYRKKYRKYKRKEIAYKHKKGEYEKYEKKYEKNRIDEKTYEKKKGAYKDKKRAYKDTKKNLGCNE
ncbi:hypothetical protein GS429_17400 [Natronorubrum sp. JWXQ-INN-674]|uniref:Fibronectin type III domain-containing protein n=1 Tax=Natronorubrum halalkaliphilum TaxID=2691917 RepID=A0A6B0VR56_9EURY|nr:hypothetical protein [Natronorubrum halalkaliphilum]MXV63805.1 hypothetical protein [Natronorubrum halalkaliphilum]